MVQTVNLATITANTTLNALNNFYLVNSSGGNLTITLPSITTNGTNYTLDRIDTSMNTVTVGATGTNMIIQNLGVTGTTGSGVTGNYSLQPQIKAGFTSYNNNWYVTNSSSTIQKAPIFSTACYSGSNPYITCACPTTATRTVLCEFPYDGTKYNSRITEIEFILSANTAVSACTGTIDIRRPGTPNPWASQTYTFSINYGTFIPMKMTNISSLPFDYSTLEIGLTGISTFAGTTLLIYSIVVR